MLSDKGTNWDVGSGIEKSGRSAYEIREKREKKVTKDRYKTFSEWQGDSERCAFSAGSRSALPVKEALIFIGASFLLIVNFIKIRLLNRERNGQAAAILQGIRRD